MLLFHWLDDACVALSLVGRIIISMHAPKDDTPTGDLPCSCTKYSHTASSQLVVVVVPSLSTVSWLAGI